MAATKIPKGIELITQFVRGQFAKRSARNTGIAGLKKASDSIVQSNAKSIEIILKDMGVDINNLKSTDDVLKHMNIHKAMMNQHLRQQFGTLNLDKGIKSLEKKQPFQGFTPKIVPKVSPGGKKGSDDLIKWFDELTGKKEGIGSLIKPGDVKKGVAPKTTKEILKTKKDRGILLRDADEDIARIKRENKQAIKDFKEKNTPEVSGIDDILKSDFEVISGTSKKGKEISEKLGITARPGFPIKESGKADLKLVKTKKKDRPSIRLMKNFEKELTDIELAKEGYNLQEIGILKRARQVMKDEGQNPDDALSWVRSEMADDAGIDFEDFMTDFDWGDFPGKAEGGRIGYAGGLIVKGGKWVIKSLLGTREHIKTLNLAPDQMKYFLNQIDDQIRNIKAGGPIPEEVIQTIRKDPKFTSVHQHRSADPDLAEMEEVLLEYGKKHAEGGRIGMMYGGDPGFAFEYGGSWADWHDQHRDQMPVEQYIKTKLPKHRLPFRELQSGGLAYMLGEPTYMKYGVGGSVGHAPWLKPSGQPQPQGQNETPTPHVAGTPDPMKAPRGIPSLAPKNMDPAYMQQQMMQQAMMGRGPGNTGQGPRTMANAGGRIGFDKGKKVDLSKRRFLKGTGAAVGLLSMLPFVGKFFKPAAKVVGKFKGTPNLMVDITKTPNMPEWYIPLIKKVLNKGDEVTDTAATAERQRVHRDILPDGDEVTVTQHLDTQTIDVSVANPKNNYLSASGAGESPYTIQYAKGTEIGPHPDIPNALTTRRSVKEPDTLKVDEPYVRQAGPDTKDVEMEFDIVDYNLKNEVHDTSVLETYATGKKVKPRGTGKVYDPYEGYSPDLKDPDIDYAKGGLAHMLGE